MQPQGPIIPKNPLGKSGAGVPDAKHKAFQEHLTRPKEVPLARPEFEKPETVIAPTVDGQQPAGVQVGQITPANPDMQGFSFLNETPVKPAGAFGGLDNSLPKRLAVVLGGLLVLIILFIVGKGLLVHGPKFTAVVAAVQQQQEITHVLNNALQTSNLSEQSKNFALTAQLALGTSQSKLLSYLTNVGTKLTPQQLGLKVSSTVDAELTNAATNATYDDTFRQIMRQQLNAYAQDLQQAYKQDTGPKGRALFSSDYDQSQLLLQQITAPQS